MFEPFGLNYVWNLAVNIVLGTGGQISEVLEACAPLQQASQRPGDDASEAWFASWTELADRMVGLADDDLGRGHELAAAARLRRGAVYYLAAERLQSPGYAPRHVAYQKMLDAFAASMDLDQQGCTRVEVPYADGALPSLFVRAGPGAGAPEASPCMVVYNGLDSTKEMVHGSGIAHELARRGIATLIVDHPGSGQALRERGMTGRHDSEHWSSACVDWLEHVDSVDPDRIGVMAWSLGGYYAPRAAAFEKRFRLCVAWGANYDWGELQHRRLANEGDRPVSHYWEHVQWVFGKRDREEFLEFASKMTLAGVTELIDVPFLTTHGAGDRQIPREYAVRQFETAVNSPKRELKVFTEREGGVEHVSADNMPVATSFISDWVRTTI